MNANNIREYIRNLNVRRKFNDILHTHSHTRPYLYLFRKHALTFAYEERDRMSHFREQSQKKTPTN